MVERFFITTTRSAKNAWNRKFMAGRTLVENFSYNAPTLTFYQS
jgi:hypothetical protein